MDPSSNCNKQLKKVNLETRGDKISDLPGEILVHILSFLSTKEAFVTSLLSSRWEFLWASVPNLEFTLSDTARLWGNDSQTNRYMDFIDRVFMFHDSVIHKFRLNWSVRADNNRLKTWLAVLVRRNIREIYINELVLFDFQLPRSFFTCKTLEVLKLNCSTQFHVSASIYFPNLKKFDLTIYTASNDLTQNFFRSCPVLEELTLYVIRNFGELIYNISSPALKKLKIHIGAGRTEIGNFGSVVHVDAPALEFLQVSDAAFVHYDLKNSSSILEAPVDIDVIAHHNQVLGNTLQVETLFQLLSSISTLKDLSLSGCTMAVSLSNSEPVEHFNPCEQDEVLSCLRYRVKEIELIALDGFRSEVILIKYLLENARALDKLTIDNCCNDESRGEWFIKEVAMLPRSSKTCQVVFI